MKRKFTSNRGLLNDPRMPAAQVAKDIAEIERRKAEVDAARMAALRLAPAPQVQAYTPPPSRFAFVHSWRRGFGVNGITYEGGNA